MGTVGANHPGQPGAGAAHRLGWLGPPQGSDPQHPQVLLLAEALDKFKPGLGDVAIVLAFTGLRWEEAVAVPATNVDLESQSMLIDRTASESGGRRDVRDEMKTRAAERVVMIPDIAMPAVRRLLDRGEAGRERSDGRLYSRLINGDRGGYLGYATWRKYLQLAHGFTAAHKDGAVTYTAHELRHVVFALFPCRDSRHRRRADLRPALLDYLLLAAACRGTT
jgi:hypothetical protein